MASSLRRQRAKQASNRDHGTRRLSRAAGSFLRAVASLIREALLITWSEPGIDLAFYLDVNCFL